MTQRNITVTIESEGEGTIGVAKYTVVGNGLEELKANAHAQLDRAIVDSQQPTHHQDQEIATGEPFSGISLEEQRIQREFQLDLSVRRAQREAISAVSSRGRRKRNRA